MRQDTVTVRYCSHLLRGEDGSEGMAVNIKNLESRENEAREKHMFCFHLMIKWCVCCTSKPKFCMWEGLQETQ